MDIQVRAYTQADLPALNRIWNEVVEDGVAFPQEELLDAESGAAFFAEQTHTAVAEDRLVAQHDADASAAAGGKGRGAL